MRLRNFIRMDGSDHAILREFMVLKDTDLVIVLELHVMPCLVVPEDGEGETKRSCDWMTKDLWVEVLSLVSVLVEGRLAETGEPPQQQGKKAKGRERQEAVTLLGKNLRLACVFRKSSACESLRLVAPGRDRPRLKPHGEKLVVGAALLTSEPDVAKQLHRAVGTAIDSEKISHYFEKIKEYGKSD